VGIPTVCYQLWATFDGNSDLLGGTVSLGIFALLETILFLRDFLGWNGLGAEIKRGADIRHSGYL